MKCAKFRALCILLVLSAPLFISACSSSSTSSNTSDNPVVLDTTPPTIVAQSPAAGALDVTRSGPYWVAFSEPMDEGMFPAGITFSPGSVSFNTSWRSDTLVITPYALIEGGMSCSITVAGTVEDAHGNALGSDVTIPFTTTTEADVTPPTVASTDPEDGATDIIGSQTIEIAFSEPMNTGATLDAIGIEPEPADGWAEWDGLTLKLHHSAFPQYSLIAVTIGIGATDLSDNHLAEPYTFEFRTRQDITRPYLASASPANGATGVSVTLASLTLTFSEAMDQMSFQMGVGDLDARINQTAQDEPTANADYSSLTVPLNNGLLPGCTYWVYFRGVKDAAGNVIDPNPTLYQFTTAGTATAFPVKNANTWHFVRGERSGVTQFFANYNQGTGTFDQMVENGEGQTQEVTHFKKTSTAIQHLGRDEYRDGVYQFSMMWDVPLTYFELPAEDHLGDSWPFSATATLDASTTMTLVGSTSFEASTVDLVSEALHGTFKGCIILHLDADVTRYVDGISVDESEVHQIVWLAPGVGPVKIVSSDSGGGGSDTLSVYDWSL
jgi:methionine-rich copper-binding protein CopC